MKLNQGNVDTLIQGVVHSQGLRTLKFIKSTLEPGSIGPLEHFLKSDHQLEGIHFDRCIVADNVIATLVNALEDHTILKDLYIGADLCNISL